MSRRGVKALDELAALQPNWDSYGAPAISKEAVRIATMLMTSPPWVTPCYELGLAT